MHAYDTIPVALLLLLAVAFPATVTATPLLTVTCDEPQGADISYGSGLLGLREPTVDTAAVGYPGLHPTFLIDDDTPQHLRVTFRDDPPNHAPSADHPPPFAAAIVYATDDQITAVAPRGEAVWMYSLFPKLGIGYFATHNHIPFGSTSRSVSTYALCHFVRHAP
jgi:hypothetical protein